MIQLIWLIWQTQVQSYSSKEPVSEPFYQAFKGFQTGFHFFQTNIKEQLFR